MIGFKKVLFVILTLFLLISTVSADNTADADNSTYTDLSNQLSSDIYTITLNQDYSFDNSTDSALKDGIKITHDVAINGNGHHIDGSYQARGLYVENCNVVLNNLTLKNCFSAHHGGAILLKFNANITIINCNFLNNKVYNSNGGAINCEGNNTVDISCSIFSNNTSIRESDLEWNKFKAGLGSVICMMLNSNLNLVNSSIINNNAYISTIIVISFNEKDEYEISKAYVKNCLFENNTSRSHSALYIDEFGQAEIIDSVFKNNYVTFFGGIITLESVKYVSLKNCLFDSNTAIRGGALYIVPFDGIQSNVSVSGCNFTSNSVSSHGGSIYANQAQLDISKCNFLRNSGCPTKVLFLI